MEIGDYNLIRSDRNRKGAGSLISFNYHRSLSENFENILTEILLPKSKPITLGIIYRPPDQSSFIDDFNIASKELASQGNKTHFLGDFNINLFFEGHYVFKKIICKTAKTKTAKTFLRDIFSFWSNSTNKQANKIYFENLIAIRSYSDKLERICNSAWCHNIRVIRPWFNFPY